MDIEDVLMKLRKRIESLKHSSIPDNQMLCWKNSSLKRAVRFLGDIKNNWLDTKTQIATEDHVVERVKAG